MANYREMAYEVWLVSALAWIVCLVPWIICASTSVGSNWLMELAPVDATWNSRTLSLWKSCNLHWEYHPKGSGDAGRRTYDRDFDETSFQCVAIEQLPQCTYRGGFIGGFKLARALYIIGIILSPCAGLLACSKRLRKGACKVVLGLVAVISSGFTIGGFAAGYITLAQVTCDKSFYTSRNWLSGYKSGIAAVVFAGLSVVIFLVGILGVLVAAIFDCCWMHKNKRSPSHFASLPTALQQAQLALNVSIVPVQGVVINIPEPVATPTPTPCSSPRSVVVGMPATEPVGTTRPTTAQSSNTTPVLEPCSLLNV